MSNNRPVGLMGIPSLSVSPKMLNGAHLMSVLSSVTPVRFFLLSRTCGCGTFSPRALVQVPTWRFFRFFP